MYTEEEERAIHEQIGRRAYQIYLEHGFHEGNDLADWLAAEKELTQQTERGDTTKPSTTGLASLRMRATA